jgi:hypothetical protein
MRAIDQLRFHEPTPSEQLSFNLIPQRMSTHSRNAVLSLCGSGKGARFTTVEMHSIGNAIEGLDDSYNEVDSCFKKLDTKDKKVKGILAHGFTAENGNDGGKIIVDSRAGTAMMSLLPLFHSPPLTFTPHFNQPPSKPSLRRLKTISAAMLR